MSLFDSIFGIVGGPIALAVGQARGGEHAADTRGGFIAAQGGLGATAIESAAGDDPRAVRTGVTADTALGGAAATVATLGAAAPAATAGTAAVAGAETGAAEAGAGAAAGVAADTAATSGAEAAGAGLSAAPTVAGTTAAEGAAGAAGAAAPEAISSAPITSGAPDMISGAAPVDTTITHPAGQVSDQTGETLLDETTGNAPPTKPGLNLKNATKIAKETYTDVKKVQDNAVNRPAPQMAPTTPYKPADTAGQLATPSITSNNQFDSIFGAPSVGTTPGLASQQQPLQATQSTPGQLGSLQTPQLLQPPPLVQPQPMVSDRNLKTNIKDADRSIQNFLAQINGRL